MPFVSSPPITRSVSLTLLPAIVFIAVRFECHNDCEIQFCIENLRQNGLYFELIVFFFIWWFKRSSECSKTGVYFWIYYFVASGAQKSEEINKK